jgi:DNA invertase Pin-like site-specific DNA recombinase
MLVDEEGPFWVQSTGTLEMDSGATATRRLAIGYVRVASVSQASPRSALDAQIAQVRAIAEAAGIELGEIVEDLGASAHNLKRPGLLKVLTAAAEGHIDVVIVGDLDRLARDPGHLSGILDSLSARGVLVMHTVRER